jgi:hypothetical protein
VPEVKEGDYFDEAFYAQFKDCDHWDCDPDAEQLAYEDIDEAIENALDPDDARTTITVFGWRRQKVTALDVDLMKPYGAITELYVGLDEEYGDQNGDRHMEPGAKVVEACKALEKLIEDDVNDQVWCCDQVCKITVDLARWRKHIQESETIAASLMQPTEDDPDETKVIPAVKAK